MVGAFDNSQQPNDQIELFLDVHCKEDTRTVNRNDFFCFYDCYKQMLVTSKDLTVGTPNTSIVPIGHPGFCFDDIANIPVTIVKLRRGQSLKLKAIAVKVDLFGSDWVLMCFRALAVIIVNGVPLLQLHSQACQRSNLMNTWFRDGQHNELSICFQN